MRLLDRESGETEVLIDEPEEILYSVAFHPNFSENGQFFVSHAGPASAKREDRRTMVRRFTMNRDAAAKVDVIQTTMDITPHRMPGKPIVFWDIPGCGTQVSNGFLAS